MVKSIIGLSGKSGSGKNYVADKYLMECFNGGLIPHYYQYSFADKIKRVVSEITNVKRNELDALKSVPSDINGLTYRQLMLTVGEGLRGLLGEDVWVKSLFSQIDKLDNSCMITDLRTPLEAHAIMRRGGAIIRIDRYASFNDWATLSHIKDKVYREEATLLSKKLFIEALKDYKHFPGKEDVIQTMMHPTETALDFYPFKYRIKNYGDEKFITDFIQLIKEINEKD